MNRRSFLAGIASIGVWAESAVAAEPEMPFAEWVNTLYVGALALREAAEAGAGADLTDRELQGLFSPEVQAMRDAVADRTLPPSEPDGPILHILFGWGALPKRKLEIRSVKADGEAKAKIDLTINGNPRPLVLTGFYYEPGKTWQIDDIDYGEGGPDRTLRGRLERMKSWPKR
ncbi:YceI family protein [Dongia sp.]|uniref:YceI family protein n=1 Tax=Dongia sp. TaxID=1977262 RepID=UPI003751133E